MAFRAIRLILGVVLVLVALALVIPSLSTLAKGPDGLRAWVPPIMALLSVGGLAAAYVLAMFRSRSIFHGFRAVLGSVVAVLAVFLVFSAAVDMVTTFAVRGAQTGAQGGWTETVLGTRAGGLREAWSTESTEAGGLTAPLVKIVLAVVLAAGFWLGMVAASGVRRVVENILSIPELVKKLAFTMTLLCIYRIGFHIPLPGLNQELVSSFMQKQEEGAFGQALEYLALFTGGNLQQSTLFGLGIMPYITASIIFQLLVTVVPALERLQKEGQAGYKKIQEYTRYATVGLCIIQAFFWMRVMRGQGLLYEDYQSSWSVFMMGVFGLTAGTIFLMWLGEQIDEYGIGNGISLIIMAGIVARLPISIQQLVQNASLKVTGGDEQIGLIKIVFLIAAFVFVVAGSILICQAQRRIPIQQAKHTRGRRVYGGQRQYLPLRVNHGGVMPIIFASSLLIIPNVLTRMVQEQWPRNEFTRLLYQAFQMNDLIYNLFYIGLIFFFSYFWTTVQFRPKDMSDQLRDYGSFIPGLRPGKRTADYLERVMERITYAGAAFLAAIAVIPQALASAMGIPFGIASFMGGTALLISVSVALDLVQRIESNLIMRNYGGFLGESGRIKGSR